MDARKILKRTLSGTALAGTLALLLVWNSGSAHGLVLVSALALVLAAAVFELSRMGRLRELELLPALALAAGSTIGLACAARARWIAEGQLSERGWSLEEALAGAHAGGYGQAALLALALAAGVRALELALGRARFLAWLVGLGLLVFVLHEPLSAGSRVLPAALLAAALLLGALPAVLAARRARELAACAGLALWLAPPLPFLFSLYGFHGTAGLVALLAISKIGDTAGYYVGTSIGRHHPFPRISPGKTAEGCLGSLAAGTAAGGACVALGLLPGDLFRGLLAGALVNLAAQSGDLLESLVKRRVGVKDSSGMFGPSGGLLDQLDSLLLSVPVAVVLWPWILPAIAGSH